MTNGRPDELAVAPAPEFLVEPRREPGDLAKADLGGSRGVRKTVFPSPRRPSRLALPCGFAGAGLGNFRTENLLLDDVLRICLGLG